MRLTFKLTGTFLLLVTIVLIGKAALRVQGEIDVYREARTRDHRHIALVLARAIVTMAHTEGLAAVDRLIGDIDQTALGEIDVRWVCNGKPGAPASQIACDTIAALPNGGVAQGVFRTAEGTRDYTYVPLASFALSELGAVEISEPVDFEVRFATAMMKAAAGTVVWASIAWIVFALLIGAWLVGRPTRQLVDQAQKIAEHQVPEQILRDRRDELGDIALAMHQMALQLEEHRRERATEVQARIEALEQLRHADRLTTVGKLASGVAHELGTPLNVIDVHASQLAAGTVPPEAVVSTGRSILDASERMAKVVEQFLSFARPRTLDRLRNDLDAIVRRATSMLSPLAARHQVAIRQLGKSGDCTVDVDEVYLQQALVNLVINAVQVSAQGRAVDVTVCQGGPRHRPGADPATAAIDTVVVHIADTGPGIAPADLPRLYEPFFTRREGGSGLGLSIAQGIVEEHGGWIEIASSLGVGSTFTIVLPVATTHTPNQGAS